MYIDINKYDDYFARSVKLKHYRGNDFEGAETDEDPVIRLNFYRKKGYTKNAMKDEHHAVRFEAYDVFGWKNALNDVEFYIREWAKTMSAPVFPSARKAR